MKKTINILGFIAVLLFSACSPIDNFDAPEETIQGKIYDSATGELLQCGTSTQIRLMEYSWDKNPTPYYITAKPDGTYKNTKIFKYCCPLKVSEQRDIHPQCCCNGIADDFSEGKPLS